MAISKIDDNHSGAELRSHHLDDPFHSPKWQPEELLCNSYSLFCLYTVIAILYSLMWLVLLFCSTAGCAHHTKFNTRCLMQISRQDDHCLSCTNKSRRAVSPSSTTGLPSKVNVWHIHWNEYTEAAWLMAAKPITFVYLVLLYWQLVLHHLLFTIYTLCIVILHIAWHL